MSKEKYANAVVDKKALAAHTKKYCAVCEKRVSKLCDLSNPSHKWDGCDVVTCENMPEGKIVKLNSDYSRAPPEPTFKPLVTLKAKAELCANCRFFVAERFCYNRPPVVSPIHGQSMRPRTEADDFCSEFTENAK